ncbi:MAG: hypothetical protein KDA60_10660, partial [Planctomycetales bacterium]|nr:hypothetical protein [Planctomycetales bacterium]
MKRTTPLYGMSGGLDAIEIEIIPPIVSEVTAKSFELWHAGSQVAFTEPVDDVHGDGRVFRIELSQPVLSGGTFALIAEPLQSYGVQPLQNKEGTTYYGERVTEAFEVVTSSATGVYATTFDETSTSQMRGWSFEVGDFDIVSQAMGTNESSVLRIASGGASAAATLQVDLAEAAGQSNLSLDFRLGLLEDASSWFDVEISGDSEKWVTVFTSPITSADGHYQFDFDGSLAAVGIALDEDVFVRWAFDLPGLSTAVWLDDVRIGPFDAIGPDVHAIELIADPASPHSYARVEFDEIVGEISTNDIAVFGPSGEVIEIVDATRERDDRSVYTLELDQRADDAGVYSVLVSSSVRDVFGNQFNPGHGVVNGRSSIERIVVPARYRNILAR